MRGDVPKPSAIDLGFYAQQRQRVPAEALAAYAGQYVAFNGDASQIVAHAAELPALFASLQAAGVPSDQVVWEWVPGPDEESWL
jgi:hypothetical protein